MGYRKSDATNPKDMIRVHFYLSKSLVDKLEKISVENSTSRSGILRAIIINYLKRRKVNNAFIKVKRDIEYLELDGKMKSAIEDDLSRFVLNEKERKYYLIEDSSLID